MAAPKGHPLWPSLEKFRKPKKFKTPDDLIQAAINYFSWCKDNPIFIKEPIRSGQNAGKIFNIPTDRPYLIEGFCLHAGMDTQTFDNYSKKKEYENYFEACRAIRGAIFNQNLEGGYTGGFNAMLVARKLGIADKVANEIDDKRKAVDELFPSEEEINEGDEVKTNKP